MPEDATSKRFSMHPCSDSQPRWHAMRDCAANQAGTVIHLSSITPGKRQSEPLFPYFPCLHFIYKLRN